MSLRERTIHEPLRLFSLKGFLSTSIIVGRLKDMIKSGGENIYPAEVEDVMHSHPAVAEAALIPVPDPKWGEVGRAIIVLKPGTSLTAADLTAWLRERMANYKVPKSVVFVDTLPKTGANKVDKPKLIEEYGHFLTIGRDPSDCPKRSTLHGKHV